MPCAALFLCYPSTAFRLCPGAEQSNVPGRPPWQHASGSAQVSDDVSGLGRVVLSLCGTHVWFPTWQHWKKASMLGGSWVVIRRGLSRITILITQIRGLITLLITTHEPPSVDKKPAEAASRSHGRCWRPTQRHSRSASRTKVIKGFFFWAFPVFQGKGVSKRFFRL